MLSAEEFRGTLEVERELALRHGLSMTLAWPRIEAAAGGHSAESLTRLVAEAILDNVRTTDICGLLRGRGASALLRCTGLEEARVVADRIERALAAKGVTVRVSLKSLLHDDFTSNEDGPSDGAGVSPEGQGLKALFVQRPSGLESMVNRLVAACLCVCAAPLAAIAALLIKLDSRGPVIFVQRRVGLGGKEFSCLKFRTMRVGADAQLAALAQQNEMDGPVFKMRDDPRVTRVGRWLRASSIDELPQLVNVLLGEMNLVGPRPPVPKEVRQYKPYERMRLDVMPGMTGLWQVSGRSNVSFSQWVRLDLRYRRRRSWLVDAKLLLLTIPAVLRRDGAW